VKADVERTHIHKRTQKSICTEIIHIAQNVPFISDIFLCHSTTVHMNYVNVLSVTVIFHYGRERAVHQVTFVFLLFRKFMLTRAYNSYSLSEYSEASLSRPSKKPLPNTNFRAALYRLTQRMELSCVEIYVHQRRITRTSYSYSIFGERRRFMLLKSTLLTCQLLGFTLSQLRDTERVGVGEIL
jgi:hypothetical protein